MAFLFQNPFILATLRGNESYPIYNFVEIHVSGLDTGAFAGGVFLTDFESDIDPASPIAVEDKDGVKRNWYSDLLSGVSPPAKTGNVTQEIQRLEIAQGLDYQFADAFDDVITAMGNSYHNAPIRVSSYLQHPETFQMITDEPIMRSNGIIKSLSRSVKDSKITVEFSNSFGKLDGLKELRTNRGSLDRRDSNDTCFDKSGEEIDAQLLKWGVG